MNSQQKKDQKVQDDHYTNENPKETPPNNPSQYPTHNPNEVPAQEPAEVPTRDPGNPDEMPDQKNL